MKSYTKLLLLIVLLISAGLASCGNNERSNMEGWKYVGDVRDESGEYVQVFIDLKGMTIENNIRKFWINYFAPLEDSDEKYVRQVGLWEVDCNDRKLFVLGEEYFDSNGKLLGKSDERIEEEYVEGSLGDRLAAAACRYAGR